MTAWLGQQQCSPRLRAGDRTPSAIPDLCARAKAQFHTGAPLSAERIQDRDRVSDVIWTAVREEILAKPLFPPFFRKYVDTQQLATGYSPVSFLELIDKAGNAAEELCLLIHVSIVGLRTPVPQAQYEVPAAHSTALASHS